MAARLSTSAQVQILVSQPTKTSTVLAAFTQQTLASTSTGSAASYRRQQVQSKSSKQQPQVYASRPRPELTQNALNGGPEPHLQQLICLVQHLRQAAQSGRQGARQWGTGHSKLWVKLNLPDVPPATRTHKSDTGEFTSKQISTNIYTYIHTAHSCAAGICSTGRALTHQCADALQVLGQPRVLQVIYQAPGSGHQQVATPRQTVALAAQVGARGGRARRASYISTAVDKGVWVPSGHVPSQQGVRLEPARPVFPHLPRPPGCTA